MTLLERQHKHTQQLPSLQNNTELVKFYSPATTAASALLSDCSQTHKATEDDEQHTSVSGGWAEKSLSHKRFESTQLHRCAS